VALDTFLDRSGTGDRGAHIKSGQKLDLIDRGEIRRIGHRQRQSRSAQVDGHDLKLGRNHRRQNIHKFIGQVQRTRIHNRQMILFLKGRKQIRLGDIRLSQDMGRESAAGFTQARLSQTKIAFGNQAVAQEELPYPTGRHLRIALDARTLPHYGFNAAQKSSPIDLSALWARPLAQMRYL